MIGRNDLARRGGYHSAPQIPRRTGFSRGVPPNMQDRWRAARAMQSRLKTNPRAMQRTRAPHKGRKVVELYFEANTTRTRQLLAPIKRNMKAINQVAIIKFNKITNKNARALHKRGIRKSPTMVFNGKKYVGVGPILQILMPPQRQQRPQMDVGAAKKEEITAMLNDYCLDILKDGDDNRDDLDKQKRTRELMRRADEMERRRPARYDSKGNKISKGRDVPRRGRNRSAIERSSGDDEHVESTSPDIGMRQDNIRPDVYNQKGDQEELLDNWLQDEIKGKNY